MYPRNGFISVEHGAAEEEGRITFRVTAADVCAVAFIPRGDLPPCGLAEVDESLRAGVAALLAEGTEPPPTSFAGAADWLAYTRQRKHRGALALVEPTAYLDRDERIVRVAFRLSSGRVGAGFAGRRFGVGAATDRRRFSVTIAEHYARIDCWQRFFLGYAGDLEGRFPGAKVAPFGWLYITCFLHVDGTATSYCASSFLPSAWFYRDYVRMGRRDVDQATTAEAEAVLRPEPDVPTGTRWTRLDTSSGCIHRVA